MRNWVDFMRKKEILKHWGFDDEVIIEKVNIEYESEREDHVWTINSEYILKKSKNEEEANNNIYMAKLLNSVNIPTQKVIDTLDGENYFVADERYYTLLTKIDGKVLKNYFEGDFIKRGNNIGKALAELHIGLSKITDEIKGKIVVFDNDLIAELNGWVIDEIDKYVKKSTLDKNEINIFKECINELLNGFRKDYYKLPRQVIHRDFHGGNIIFKDEDIVGVIDFDLSQINARLFDICYLCTGSLTTIFNDTEMRDKWIQFIKAFIQGYQSVNKLTYHEIKSMKNMMLSIEIVMVAYFAREGYEDIANNNIKMANYLNELWQNKWDGENGGIIVK